MSEIINQRDWYLKLYKFYMQLILKICVVFFSGASVLAAYMLSHPEHTWLKHTLIAPFVIGISVSIVFFRATLLASNMEEAVRVYSGKMGLSDHWPTTVVLGYVLWVFGFAFAVTSLAIMALYIIAVCRGIRRLAPTPPCRPTLRRRLRAASAERMEQGGPAWRFASLFQGYGLRCGGNFLIGLFQIPH